MDNRIKRRDKRMMVRSPIMAFLDKHGIYLVMIGCLAIIGIAAYFTFGGSEQAKVEPSPSQQQANAVVTPVVQQTATPATQKPVTPTATAKPAAVSTQKPILPVQGDVLRKFSLTDPVYYPTINAWMVHTGVDIQCAEGTAVKASLDGTVESVKNDPTTGYTIVIKSTGNIETLYGNLAAPENIKVGQTIKQGDVIGAVGKSEQDVVSDPAHLHFAFLVSGKYKDPIAQCK